MVERLAAQWAEVRIPPMDQWQETLQPGSAVKILRTIANLCSSKPFLVSQWWFHNLLSTVDWAHKFAGEASWKEFRKNARKHSHQQTVCYKWLAKPGGCEGCDKIHMMDIQCLAPFDYWRRSALLWHVRLNRHNNNTKTLFERFWAISSDFERFLAISYDGTIVRSYDFERYRTISLKIAQNRSKSLKIAQNRSNDRTICVCLVYIYIYIYIYISLHHSNWCT